MKRALVISALMLQVVAFFGVSRAQTEEPKYLRLPHRFQIFLEGGGSVPSQPSVFKDLWNPAFGLGIGAGVSIFPWLEVNGGFTVMSFALNSLSAKGVLGYQGIKEVEGGAVSTKQFYGSARFIAVPKARTNPFVEAAVGYYKTSGDNVVIEDEINNSMESVSGMFVSPSVGIQYALGDYWTAYTRYCYILNLSDKFAPATCYSVPRACARLTAAIRLSRASVLASWRVSRIGVAMFRRTAAGALLVIALSLAAWPGTGRAEPHTRTGWYAGLGYGGCWANVDLAGIRESEWAGTVTLRAGRALRQDLLLGGEFIRWAKDYTLATPDGYIPVGVKLGGTVMAVTYFPGNAGFMLRGGLGVALAEVRIDVPVPGGVLSAVSPDPGLAAVLSAGYEARLTARFALGAGFDVLYLGVRDDAMDSTYVYGLNSQFNWYW